MTSFAKRKKKKKGNAGKKNKVDPKDIYNYCKEPGHWK